MSHYEDVYYGEVNDMLICSKKTGPCDWFFFVVASGDNLWEASWVGFEVQEVVERVKFPPYQWYYCKFWWVMTLKWYEFVREKRSGCCVWKDRWVLLTFQGKVCKLLESPKTHLGGQEKVLLSSVSSTHSPAVARNGHTWKDAATGQLWNSISSV